MEIIIYNKSENKIIQTDKLDNIDSYINNNQYILWFIFNQQNKEFDQLSNILKLHPVVINSSQVKNIPKLIVFESYIFTIFHIANHTKHTETFEVTFILGSNYIATINKTNNKFFNEIIEKIKQEKFVIQKGPDFILHQIIETILEYNSILIHNLNSELIEIEDKILADQYESVIEKLAFIRKKLIYLKDIIFYQTECLGKLTSKDNPFVSKINMHFFIDAYNKSSRINSEIDSINSLVINLYNLYVSIISKKTNEIMQTLMIISTIFLPITSIAAIYGMNFPIPEAKYVYAYYAVLFIMIIITSGSLIYLKRKKWF